MCVIAEMRPAIENLRESSSSTSPNDDRAVVVIGGEEHRQWLAAAVNTDVQVHMHV